MKGKHDGVLTRALLVTGGIWQVEPVAQQPHAVLQRWQVYELEDGARHLVGWCPDACEGRVTSAVAVFDPQTRSARTASGRVYELRGASGHDADADYVWGRLRALNRVSSWHVVTAQVESSLAPEGGKGRR